VSSSFTVRRATFDDVPALTALIAESARGLSAGDYTPGQVEGALRGAFGVDTQLLRDGTYFVIEAGERLVACGGWSRRQTLFGSDARADRDARELDPAVDAARIRAFFVHPEFARRGLGTRLLERCERDASSHGFRRAELMATLPGVKLYAARGYRGDSPVDWPLDASGHLTIRFLPMQKPLPNACRIERAGEADIPAILDLQKRAYESEAVLYADRSLPPLTQTLESLRAELGQSVVLKAVDGDTLIGSVRARTSDGTCHIGRLIVAPGRQGCGIGTRLMHEIEACFDAAHRFELFTGSRSAGNLRLYERLGYTRCREQAVSPTITLVFLEKRRPENSP
jgi:ribosomal protein S18 acetylase RimI-like enzyme